MKGTMTRSVVLWGILAVSVAHAQTVDLTLFNTRALLDQDGITKLEGTSSGGDVVQLIRVGPNGIVDEPGTNGLPGGDDTLVNATANPTYVGAGLATTNTGLLAQSGMVYNSTNVGAQVYVRFWNASTLAAATFYGNSAITNLPPADGFGQAELDFAPAPSSPVTANRGMYLNEWTFSDVAGTDIAATTNTGLDPTSDSFNDILVDAAIDTDGSGLLVNTETTDRFRYALVSAITSGTSHLQWDLAAWDQSDNNGGQMRVQFRGPGGVALAGLSIIQTADTNGMRLRYVNGTTPVDVVQVPTTTTAGASMILSVNLDTDRLDFWYRIGSSGPYIQGANGVQMSVTNSSIEGIRVESFTNVGGPGGDYMSTDRIIHTALFGATGTFGIPTMGEWAMIGLGVLIASVVGRRMLRKPATA